MNAEHISDALNFLDEDLIAQTDEVRRGKRPHRVPLRGIVAAAACTVLVATGVFFFPPAAREDSASMAGEMEQFYGSNAGDRKSVV